MTPARSLILVALLAAPGCDDVPPPPVAATSPTTAPATMPATTLAATTRPAPRTLLDVVRADDATFPTTRPLDETLELSAAARLRFEAPVYLCSRGDLWLTHADASPAADVLAVAPKQQTHVTRERVRFVYWRPTGQPWSPEIVHRDADGTDVWVTAAARLPLDRALARDWTRAGSWTTDAMRAAVVPTATGMSVIRVADGRVDERHVALLDAAGPGTSTHFVLDPRGLLAWSIDPSGASKVARFIDDEWTLLTPATAWPDRLLHVVPFQDGSVLAIAQADRSLALKSVALEAIPVDKARVAALVKRLASRDPGEREQAQADLAQVGPGAWPLLRELAPTQPAEARIRIRAVLGNETTPTLGGIAPEPGPARIVCRLSDGGVVLFFQGGVSAVNANGLVQPFAPAWLAVRPGEAARRLPESLTRELAPASVRLSAHGDEWVVEHDVDGPKRWMGNHNEPMLTKREAATFKRFAGIDSAGRWVFNTVDPDGPTLVVDPTLPDPRPRLPVWTISGRSSVVGWTDDGWPVRRQGAAFALKDGGWVGVTGDVDGQVTTSLPKPTTSPATTRASVLLTDADGNRYSDGLETLVVETPAGRRLAWPLPAEATGGGVIDGAAVLIEADGKLFLCNAAGKLARITRQLDESTPFTLDAVFTRNIPGGDIRRIWKDPAGRIVFASNGNTLSIAFPGGRISSAMSNMIPAGALRQAFEEEDGDAE